MIESGFLLWYLFLALALAVVAFFAGRASHKSYLEAARGVSDVTNAFATQSNLFQGALDKATTESASLRRDFRQLEDAHLLASTGVEKRLENVETSVYALLQGLGRAGIASVPRPTPGRQVGEAGP